MTDRNAQARCASGEVQMLALGSSFTSICTRTNICRPCEPSAQRSPSFDQDSDKSSPTAGLTVSPAEPEQQEETPAAQQLQTSASSRSRRRLSTGGAEPDAGTEPDPCEESFGGVRSLGRGGNGPSRSLLRLLIYTLGLLSLLSQV